MSFYTCMLISAGGAVGTLSRYLIAAATLPISRDLPWGTIGINILGSFIIGFFGTLTLATGRYPVSEDVRLFVMVGFCGGFTTFSAFSFQTLELLRNGAVYRAGLNATLSVVLCVAAVAAGHAVAAHYNDNARKIAQIDIEEEA